MAALTFRWLLAPLVALAAWTGFAAAAYAGEGERLLQKHWAEGTLAQGAQTLSARVRANPRDQEAVYALGVIQLARAVEALGQAMYRHGLDPQVSQVLPFEIVPSTALNPNPAPLTADGLKAVLRQTVADLDKARATLSGVTSANVKLRLDLTAIKLDLDADGRADPPADPEQIAAYFERMTGDRPPREAIEEMQAGANPTEPLLVSLDLADARWMQGYAQLTAAPLDFFLAHNFDAMINATFHRLFPRAGFPLQDTPRADNADANFTGSDTLFADAIAMAHLFTGPVMEPERRARVRTRLLDMIALSRETFALAARERDNDREWLPSPRQTGVFTDLTVTQARAKAWMDALSLAEDVLQGRQLIPHWRFQKGVDLKAFFESKDDFDLITLVTGSSAAPYLRDGPKLDFERAAAIEEAFGGNFWMFAFWFN